MIRSGRSSSVEQHLQCLEQQLTQLKAQVRQAQQLASMGTAAAFIAHEVNNLLTPILSYAKASLDADDPDLQRKALTVTVKNVNMLIAMSERVLEISAAKPRQAQAVSVRTVVQDAIDSLCRDLDKDGIRLTIDIDEMLTAWVDPQQLQQVLFNLFVNARNAMAKSHNGRIDVTGARMGEVVTLVVEDTGPGIAPELVPDIFDPLQTSKQSSANGRQRCAGLGLALCRDLVEENGGAIEVTSEPGQGTKFIIHLPSDESSA